MPSDEEQRVVDPHAEADHAADHRSPARDVDQVGDQRQRADAEREAEQGHPDRQTHRDDGSERQEQDDDRGDQADQLADAGLRLLEREEQVAAELDLQGRVLAAPGAELLEVLQVDGSSSSSTGYWTRISATRPSGEMPPGRLTPGRGTSWAGASDAPPAPAASAARACAEPKNVASSSRGVSTTCAVSPALVRPGGGQQVGGLLRVEPRRAEGVLELLAEGTRRADDEHRHDQPGPDARPTGGVRRGDPTGTEHATSSVFSFGDASCGCRNGRPTCSHRHDAQRRGTSGEGLDLARPSGRGRVVPFGRSVGAP